MRLYKGIPKEAIGQVPAHGFEHPLFTGSTPIGMMSGEAPRGPSAPGGHEGLKQDLTNLGLKYEETEGRYGIPERSMIIHGPSREMMYHLGKRYGQEAVIHSNNGKHEFIYTHGENEGKSHPGLGTYDSWGPTQELPEDYYTKLPNQGAFRLHFDFDHVDHVPMAGAPGPITSPQAGEPSHVQAPMAAGMSKHDIGHKLYKNLTKLIKAYDAVPGSEGAPDPVAQGSTRSPAQYSASFDWLPHPHFYDWHDGCSAQHYPGSAPGGVLISKGSPVTPTRPDGLIKSIGEDGHYKKTSMPFGKHTDGKSDLNHYDYRGKQPDVDRLLSQHGYQSYYAGGAHGKPDLSKRNYDTKHLMIHDTSKIKDDGNTDSWRKAHELGHALTHEQVNSIYGEGKRTGKLGHHRSLKEAMRAVHWEWMAAHKQRELNKQVGIHVPEETFNKELNTVMHDATHRVVHGKAVDAGSHGFVPHSHKVPLETSLGLVREAARNLGLQGDHDLLNKTEDSVSKTLNVPEALTYLHDKLQERIDEFAKSALELRKKETLVLSKKAKKTKKDEEPAADAGGGNQNPMGGEDDLGGLGGSDNMSMNENAAGPDGSEAASMDSGAGMALNEKKKMKKFLLPGEQSKFDSSGMGAGGGGSSEPKPTELPDPPQVPPVSKKECDGSAMCKCAKCEGIFKYAKGEISPGKKIKNNKFHGEAGFGKAQPNTYVDNSGGKGVLPPKNGGKDAARPDANEGGNNGTNTTAGKKIAKAGMAMGGAQPPALPAPKPAGSAAPKMAGAAIPPPHPSMKPMKLPGVSTTPKLPGMGAKPPAMGAGSTGGAGGMGKSEIKKSGPVSLGQRAMAARRKFGDRTQNEQAAKLPGVRSQVSSTMDSMLAPKTLPATQGAVPGVGHPIARPAQGVKTMAERVASAMPPSQIQLTPPPASANVRTGGPTPALSALAAKHMPAKPAAQSPVPSLGALAAAHSAKPAPTAKPVQTMVERVASRAPNTAAMAVPGEKSHTQLISEARKNEKKFNKSERAFSGFGSCALCKKSEHIGPC